MAQESFEEIATEIVIEDIAKEKFTFKKIGSFYFIIDTETGSKCITQVGKTKPFRTRVKDKLALELMRLREGYKKQLEQGG
jgi:hypothetical protein